MNEVINQPVAGSGIHWNSRRRAVRTWLGLAVGVAAVAGIVAAVAWGSRLFGKAAGQAEAPPASLPSVTVSQPLQRGVFLHFALHFAFTRDNGKTWTEGARLDGFLDRPFLAVDTTGGKYSGRLYCHHLGGLCFSNDLGKTFSTPKTWSVRRTYNPPTSGTPAVLSGGSLVVLYNSVKLTAPSNSKTPNAYLAVRRSEDGGETFLEERLICHHRYNQHTLPNMVADRTDHLYAVWADTLAHDELGLYVSSSADKGETWSKPFLLSEQCLREPTAKSPTHQAYLGTIAVNEAGVIGVIWYDTRDIPESQIGWNLRFRASLDGGKTWEPSIRVSEETTLYPKGYKAKARSEQYGFSDKPGHTAGLTADANGDFRALWVDGRSGVRQLYTAAIAVGRTERARPLPPGHARRARRQRGTAAVAGSRIGPVAGQVSLGGGALRPGGQKP
jgi:hypothetical protein